MEESRISSTATGAAAEGEGSTRASALAANSNVATAFATSANASIKPGPSNGSASGFVARLAPETEGFPPIVLDRTTPSVSFGRTQQGAGRVDHEQVSGLHCTLALDAETGNLTFTDTSTNGSYVDGHIVPKRSKNKPIELAANATFSIVAKSAADSRKRFIESGWNT